MRWPWQRAEKRNYTDALVSLLLARGAGSAGPAGRAGATGTVEAIAGMWGRALSSAEVTGGPLASTVTPELLDLAGRELIRTGETVFVFDLPPRLQVGSSWTVWGEADPETWTYEVTLPAPSSERTIYIPRSAVAHLQWGQNATDPWKSYPPIDGLTGDLLAALEQRLGEEAAGTVAHLLAVPIGPEAGDFDSLKQDIRDASGSTVLTETTAGGYGDAGSAPRKDLVPSRIGANPPQALVELRREAIGTASAAAGIPADLVTPGGDGTGAREAYRRFVFLAVAPTALRVSREFARVLETEVKFSFGGLAASDLAARGRALKQLVESGVGLDDALEKVGLT